MGKFGQLYLQDSAQYHPNITHFQFHFRILKFLRFEELLRAHLPNLANIETKPDDMSKRKNIKVLQCKKCKQVFTTLPSELLSLLLSDWLEWTDVGHFDSAICNKRRKDWLNLLRNHCIFRTFSPGHWGYPPFFRWVLSRGIRARDVFIGMCPLFNVESATQWFQHSGPFLTALTFHQIKDFVKEAIVLYCFKLLVLCINDCTLDEPCWDIFRNNSNLQELRVNMSPCPAESCAFPTNLTIPHLQRLELSGDYFTSENTGPLLQQLPSLRSIKFDQSYITAANDSLINVCLPNLVHLHLECKYHSISDNYSQKFVQVLQSLRTGLRGLILPANHSFSSVELHCSTQYHGHSLRCLSIQDKIDWTAQYLDIDFAEQINQMSQLHTLQMTFKSLQTLPSSITNPSITHLYLNNYSNRYSIADMVSLHCPSLCTLSLYLPDSDKARLISDIVLLVKLRPLICTLCVNDDDILAELRKKLKHIDIVKYKPIDIFCKEY